MSKKENHYINKLDFHEALIKYKSNEGGKLVENFVGQCILDICDGLARKPNFSGYTYIDEMKADARENCIMAITNYDIDNPQRNPFWYFSKIACYAFIRRIQSEKKQAYIKHKNAQEYYLHGKIEDIESSELSDRVIEDFEKKQAEIKLKKERSK